MHSDLTCKNFGLDYQGTFVKLPMNIFKILDKSTGFFIGKILGIISNIQKT